MGASSGRVARKPSWRAGGCSVVCRGVAAAIALRVASLITGALVTGALVTGAFEAVARGAGAACEALAFAAVDFALAAEDADFAVTAAAGFALSFARLFALELSSRIVVRAGVRADTSRSMPAAFGEAARDAFAFDAVLLADGECAMSLRFELRAEESCGIGS